MNWDAVSAIGQSVSALALVLVLVQVRQARDQVRLSSRDARRDRLRENWLGQAVHIELASALMRLTATENAVEPYVDYAKSVGLTDVEARQVYAYWWASWQSMQGSIESVAHLSPGQRQELDRSIVRNFTPGRVWGKWYELTKQRLDPDAVHYIDDVLAKS